MLLIPAIDIKDGKCVRLRQGDMNDQTVFAENPVDMADRWVEEGTQRLHLVDLDGAVAGKPMNLAVVKAILDRHPDLDVQIGGGIRTAATIQAYLDVGVRYVILGTAAVKEPHFVADMCMAFPSHIIVGLDAKDGMVAVDGWSKISTHTVIETAQRFEEDGVEAIIFTDIGKDGMMQGVNIDATVELAQAIRIPVIASGGVSTMEDIQKLLEVAGEGIDGAIIGRALYEGTIDLKAATELATNFQKTWD